MSAFMDEAALSEALAGRRVLVTGHTGFKGGWLCMWLRRLGAKVVGVSLPPMQHSFCNAVQLEELIDSRLGDIRSVENFRAAIAGEEFDLVVHLAAQAIVRTCYKDPLTAYMTNVIGTATVLEAARAMRSLKAAIVVTSDKCYENSEWVWGYREHDPMGGHDPYSSSKGCAELVAAAYRASFFSNPHGPQLATVRAGNVIGGGDWSVDRLVPDLIRALESGVPARLRNPYSVRPWLHVLEPLRGYLMLAARLLDTGSSFAGAWNFGCDRDEAVDVVTLAELVTERFGGTGPGFIIEADRNGPAESTLLRLDSTKAFVELGWKPRFTVEEAILKTVAWYREFHRSPGAIRAFTENQIAEYAEGWSASSPVRPASTSGIRVAACV